MTPTVTRDVTPKPFKLNSATTRTLLIVAQLLALVVFILALEFLRRTTGGTLFLFSTIGPVLALIAVAAVLGVATYRFLRRHSLFEVEEIEPGQVIFRQGEEGDCAYFIHDADGNTELAEFPYGERVYLMRGEADVDRSQHDPAGPLPTSRPAIIDSTAA